MSTTRSRRIRTVVAWVALGPMWLTAAAGTERHAFDVEEGLNLNSFLQAGPVDAHLVLRAGADPRILVAFPAGDSGVGVWFRTTREPVTWRLDERPQPVTLRDEKGRPLHGITARATATASELELKQVLVSSVRVLRDYQTFGGIPPEVEVAPVEQGRTLLWKRDRLDGAAGYRLRLEVTHGGLQDRRMIAGADGRIGIRLTALTGDPPLAPLTARELLRSPAQADRATLNVLGFLSYREKFLAGSWRYDTYFGRDTLMALRLLLPVLSPDAVEDGLGSVLTRLSSTGEVAHEEEIGEFAVLDHLRARDGLSDAPVYDYKMIDGSFMLAPVAAAWLLAPPADHVGSDRAGADRARSDRAAAFLARPDGAQGRAPRSFGADLLANLRFVIRSARDFAAHPEASELISLKPGFIWGQWRDSDDGIAHGRYPYDVNAVFVPAALDAAARFFDSGLLTAYLAPDDRALLSQASELGRIWHEKAAGFFEVDVTAETARGQIGSYARDLGVSPDAALRATGDSPVQFHALALDAAGTPIPIVHSDEGFELLFGHSDAQALAIAIDPVMRPFPAGLMTDAGLVVANPVFATPALKGLFTQNAYHGTVIWSWQQAVWAAGLARQLARDDLPPAIKERLRLAQTRLWRAIEAARPMINSELWTWTYRNGHYEIAPFGTHRTDADESNAAQLWSTVFLAIHPPGAHPTPARTAIRH